LRLFSLLSGGVIHFSPDFAGVFESQRQDFFVFPAFFPEAGKGSPVVLFRHSGMTPV
jgi:hypothetical protein